MFNPKMKSRKKHIIPPQTLCFFVFYCCCDLKIMQGQFFLYVAVKASKMAAVFGECGRQCLSGPGNSVSTPPFIQLGKVGGKGSLSLLFSSEFLSSCYYKFINTVPNHVNTYFILYSPVEEGHLCGCVHTVSCVHWWGDAIPLFARDQLCSSRPK
jgi:hypothetical protein